MQVEFKCFYKYNKFEPYEYYYMNWWEIIQRPITTIHLIHYLNRSYNFDDYYTFNMTWKRKYEILEIPYILLTKLFLVLSVDEHTQRIDYNIFNEDVTKNNFPFLFRIHGRFNTLIDFKHGKMDKHYLHYWSVGDYDNIFIRRMKNKDTDPDYFFNLPIHNEDGSINKYITYLQSRRIALPLSSMVEWL